MVTGSLTLLDEEKEIGEICSQGQTAIQKLHTNILHLKLCKCEH